MVNFPGRNARRRRVLNEEVRSASSARLAICTVAADEDLHAAPRYSEAAGVEHHPQVTDFVPRRHRAIALLVLVGLSSTATLVGLHYLAQKSSIWPESAFPSAAAATVFDLAAPGSIASWVSALALLVASAVCVLIYSIRRHRIDDIRGRYRIWLAAALAALMLSASSVAGLHHALAETLGHVTGWTALRGGAVWWLALAGLPLAWIAFRTLLDVKESRLAAAMLTAAVVSYAMAAAVYLGVASGHFEPLVETMLHSGGRLLAHWLLLAAAVAYARFVILDAQGLIPRASADKVSGVGCQVSDSAGSRERGAGAEDSGSELPAPRSPLPPRHPTPDTRHLGWVDGSRAVRERYDDESTAEAGDRKLSKADRKRLRKLKTQNRAA